MVMVELSRFQLVRGNEFPIFFARTYYVIYYTYYYRLAQLQRLFKNIKVKKPHYMLW